LGYDCDSAVNGKEVVKMVNKKQYDLLLLDCQMPEMDGFAATTEILRRFPEAASRPYIIAVTAHGNEGDKQKSKSVGMDGFITKPFSIQLLKETLQNVCLIKNIVHKSKWKRPEAG
jgi:CheY-like chemotaxis protein